ncbi:MAG TPA: ferritin-like domain-containing protein [Gemmatimonadaceae bacterium]|nr:ferritin-like domain-containing protein [Gemmatimonadaceae bacterium]
MRLESMQDVFVEQLKDVLNAEKQLTKALPKMAKGAHSPKLREAFENHLRETETHVERLEQVFERLGKRAQGKMCHGMEGLIKEGQEAIDAEGEDALVDTEIIAAAQRVEHYEIAAYGNLVTFAQMMGNHEAAELLKKSLGEEEAADKKLTAVFKDDIASDALDAGMAEVGASSSSSSSSSSSAAHARSGSGNGGARSRSAQSGERAEGRTSSGRSTGESSGARTGESAGRPSERSSERSSGRSK